MLVSLSHLAAKLTMFIWVLCIIIWYTSPCHKKAVPNKKSGLTATIAASGLAWNWLGKECLKRIMLGLNVCWNGHRHSSCGFVGTDHRADPGLNPKHTSYAFSMCVIEIGIILGQKLNAKAAVFGSFFKKKERKRKERKTDSDKKVE